MESVEKDIDSERHKCSNSVTSTSSNCVENSPSPDLPEHCQEDAVFTETVIARRELWSSICCRYVKNNMLLSIATIILVVCLVVNWIMMDVLTRSFIQDFKQGLVLRESTSSAWTHPKVHSHISFYTFMISEPDGQDLSVSESGPYVYRVNVEKVGVIWHSNSTVSYRERYTLFYDPIKSVSEKPSHVSSKAFEVLFQANNSVSPMLNIYTGESDFSKLYQTYSYDYATNMSAWSSEGGNNQISGTDGSMFQPCLTQQDQLTLFYPQLLRTFELKYSGLTTYKDLPVYRYTIPNSAFVNSSGSCSNTEAPLRADGANCAPSGVYNFFTPSSGLVYISLPHFLGADPYYRQHMNGLDPQESKHRPVFDVDKVTGKTVMLKRRFQVNLHHMPLQWTEFYLPLYWAELSQEVDEDDLQSIQKASGYLRTVSVTCLCVGLFLGLLLAAVLSILVYKAVKRRNLPNQYRQLHTRPDQLCCKQLKKCF